MNIPLNDGRPISLGLIDPQSGKWWDWTANNQLGPFIPAKSLKPMATIPVQADPSYTPPAGLFGGLKSLDDGAALVTRPGLSPVFFVVDASGNPVDGNAIVDVWPNPVPVAMPIHGGWSH